MPTDDSPSPPRSRPADEQSPDGPRSIHYHFSVGSIDIKATQTPYIPASADDDEHAKAEGAGAQDTEGDESDRKEKKEGDAKADKPKEEQKPHSKTPFYILAAVIIVAGIVAFMFWFARRNEVRTDDAYTDGNSIEMSPKVAGYAIALYVNDNVRVKKGELLLKIEPRDYLIARAQAQAQLQDSQAQLASAQLAYDIAKVQYPAQLVSAQAQQRTAEAALTQARASSKRQHAVDPLATTAESIDSADSQNVSAVSNVANAKAQVAIAALIPQQLRQAAVTIDQRTAGVAQAQAQLDQANLNLEYTEIRAPCDGFITKRAVNVGTYLTAGAAIFLLVTPEVWVTANFKETQLGRMRPGDPVDLLIDAYSGLKLAGHVQSIQQGSGSHFSAFPTENATGNYVKIVQRVPVKIAIDRGIDPNAPPPLGLSVSPVVRVQ